MRDPVNSLLPYLKRFFTEYLLRRMGLVQVMYILSGNRMIMECTYGGLKVDGWEPHIEVES